MERIRAALRAVGITVKKSADMSRPHVYVTVFLDRVGAAEKAWLYIGKHSAGSTRYLGSGTRLGNAVKKYGKDRFVRFVVEYSDETVACSYCPKEQHWLNKMRAAQDPRFFNVSSSSTGFSKADARRRTKDPEWRRKNLEANRLLSKDPEVQRKRKIGRDMYWSNPEARKRASLTQKERWKDPEAQRRASESAKKRFSNPAERQKASIAQKKRFSNPEELRKHVARTATARKTPEVRKKLSDSAKRRFQDPEERLAASKVQKALHAKYPDLFANAHRTTEARRNHAEGAKLYHAFKRALGIPHIKRRGGL